MQTYWSDVRLLFQRIRGAKPVVVHVEPDLWGYIQQGPNASGDLRARSFAQQWVRLRDQLAPNVMLAWHMSGWGTKHDIVYEDPPDATVRTYATRSARFYTSLNARFDVSFEDFSDRDAGFYEKVQGQPEHLVQAGRLPSTPALRADVRAPDRTAHWPPGRFRSATRSCARWTTPGVTSRTIASSGSSVRRAACTCASTRPQATSAFLFGGGADGTTCACDARHDGVTDPDPIDGNTRASVSAEDDGGYFKAQARAYYRTGVLRLPVR